MRNPQLNRQGALNHLLTTEGLPPRILNRLLDLAQHYLLDSAESVNVDASLSGRRVFSLFFEKSLSTRPSFETAAKRLSADVVRVQIENAVLKTGDDLVEIIRNLQAAPGDLLVLRHPQSGAPYLVTQTLAPYLHVINAGDGTHAHPTQALANVYAIRHFKNDLSNLTVAIVADVMHSREARSTIHALTSLGVAEVRVIGPLSLMPKGLEQMGVRVFTQMCDGLRDADVVIALPLQNERLPVSLRLSAQDYAEREGIKMETLAYAKSDCLLLQAELAGQTLRVGTLNWAEVGIAVRAAALSMVAEAQP